MFMNKLHGANLILNFQVNWKTNSSFYEKLRLVGVEFKRIKIVKLHVLIFYEKLHGAWSGWKRCKGETEEIALQGKTLFHIDCFKIDLQHLLFLRFCKVFSSIYIGSIYPTFLHFEF